MLRTLVRNLERSLRNLLPSQWDARRTWKRTVRVTVHPTAHPAAESARLHPPAAVPHHQPLPQSLQAAPAGGAALPLHQRLHQLRVQASHARARAVRKRLGSFEVGCILYTVPMTVYRYE